jgi:hypothetical protein
MTGRWFLAAAATLALIAVGHACAELPPLIPREILFGNPEGLNPQSPTQTRRPGTGAKVPLLIRQGANDVRVAQASGRAVVEGWGALTIGILP